MDWPLMSIEESISIQKQRETINSRFVRTSNLTVGVGNWFLILDFVLVSKIAGSLVSYHCIIYTMVSQWSVMP